MHTIRTVQVKFSSTICFCSISLPRMNPREGLSHLRLHPEVGGPSYKFLGNEKSLLTGQKRAQASPEMVQPAHQPLGKKMGKELSPLQDLGLPHGQGLSPSPLLLSGCLSSSNPHKGRAVNLKQWRQKGLGSNPGSVIHHLRDLGQGLSPESQASW